MAETTTSYACKRCGYDPKVLSVLKKHYQRKTMCKPLLGNQSYEELLKELDAQSTVAAVTPSVTEENAGATAGVLEEKKPLGKRDDLPEFLKFLLSQKYVDDELKAFFGDGAEGYNMRLNVFEEEDADAIKIEKLKKMLNFVLELVLENKLLLFRFHEDMKAVKRNITFTHVTDSSLSTLVD